MREEGEGGMQQFEHAGLNGGGGEGKTSIPPPPFLCFLFFKLRSPRRPRERKGRKSNASHYSARAAKTCNRRDDAENAKTMRSSRISSEAEGKEAAETRHRERGCKLREGISRTATLTAAAATRHFALLVGRGSRGARKPRKTPRARAQQWPRETLRGRDSAN